MHLERSGQAKFAGFLGIGACALLCVFAIEAGLMIHSQPAQGLPQASSAGQSAQGPHHAQAVVAAAEASDPDLANDDDDGPSPGNFLGSTYVPSSSAPNQPVIAAAPPPPAPFPADAGGDAARQQINNETANLLALAYALKAEVDKTNQNQLSISVVRKAGQIEQMARKMRDELRPLQQSRN